MKEENILRRLADRHMEQDVPVTDVADRVMAIICQRQNVEARFRLVLAWSAGLLIPISIGWLAFVLSIQEFWGDPLLSYFIEKTWKLL